MVLSDTCRARSLAAGLTMGVERGGLELGHQLSPDPVRTTSIAPAIAPTPPHTAPPSGYAPPQVGSPWKQGRFSGQDFAIQPDGTLRCPAGQSLVANERRREADGSLRVVYAASIRSCRLCSLREQCQWQGSATKKPRQVSVLLHPLNIGSAPLLWRDWSRRHHRRACRQRLAFPTGGDTGRSGPPCQFGSRTCALIPCSARALSSRLSRAVRS